ncbi:constituent protein [Rhizobium phage RHph_N3_19]|nr:constituent protein [Rhizobium phage RHph_N3_19]
MSKIHLILPDLHSHPDFSNDRADWMGKLIVDLKPDVVVNLGDQWDFASMAGYDKGKKSFWGRTFRKDIDAGLDFDERLWAPIRKAKKKRPYSVFLEGNHEYRLKRAIELQPELEGTIGFGDLQLDKNYDEIVEYSGGTPGVTEVDGVHYAHYFVSGVLGRAISGEHPAYSLISKQYTSCTCGHIHTTDYAVRTDPRGKKLMGLVAGVGIDYQTPWAGNINSLWWRGVIIKREVINGTYSPQWVSMEELRRIYS